MKKAKSARASISGVNCLKKDVVTLRSQSIRKFSQDAPGGCIRLWAVLIEKEHAHGLPIYNIGIRHAQ